MIGRGLRSATSVIFFTWSAAVIGLSTATRIGTEWPLSARRATSSVTRRSAALAGKSAAGPAAANAPRNSRRRAMLRLLRERVALVLDRQRAHGLARGGEDRVQHGGRHDADRGLAHAAPEIVRRHDHRLDLRHLAQQRGAIGVE